MSWRAEPLPYFHLNPGPLCSLLYAGSEWHSTLHGVNHTDYRHVPRDGAIAYTSGTGHLVPGGQIVPFSATLHNRRVPDMPLWMAR